MFLETFFPWIFPALAVLCVFNFFIAERRANGRAEVLRRLNIAPERYAGALRMGAIAGLISVAAGAAVVFAPLPQAFSPMIFRGLLALLASSIAVFAAQAVIARFGPKDCFYDLQRVQKALKKKAK